MNIDEFIETILLNFRLNEKSGVILKEILQRADSSNQVFLTSHVKDAIMKSTGRGFQVIDRFIIELAEKNLIQRLERGSYKLNKKYFTKCWKDIDWDRGMEVRIYSQDGNKTIFCYEHSL